MRCWKARLPNSSRPASRYDVITVPGALEIPAAIAIALDAAEKQRQALRRRHRAGLRDPRRHHPFRDRVDRILARADGSCGGESASRSATASSPSTPTRRPGRGRGRANSTRAAMPRARRSPCCGSSAAWRQGLIMAREAKKSARQKGQPPRRGAAGGGAGAVPDGHRRRRHQRHFCRVRKPLARRRGRGRQISSGRSRVFPRCGVRRGARSGKTRSLDRRCACQKAGR